MGRAAYQRGDCKWFQFTWPLHRELYDSPKIVVPYLAPENRFAIDRQADYIGLTDTYAIFLQDDIATSPEYVLAVLNSKLVEFRYQMRVKDKGTVYEYFENGLEKIPVPLFESVSGRQAKSHSVNKFESNYETWINSKRRGDSSIDVIPKEVYNRPNQTEKTHDILSYLANQIIECNNQHSNLNLNLLDYLGTYTGGQALAELYQPPAGLADSILSDTAADRENLKIESATVTSDGSKLVLRTTARYKPENPDEYETDQYEYTETDPLPAMEFVGLSKGERALVEAFVPYAVEEAGGFANFRENATKTNSLIDRLEALTLPALDDVADGLERYRETKARAEELDEKIGKTDELIDQIVYELYGLTDEEIEIVEEAVGD